MAAVDANTSQYNFQALSPDNWTHFEKLFGVKGACGGCWCMWWKVKKSIFDASKGNGNKQKMMADVQAGAEPGILAFDGDQAVGWCAIAPREAYPRLENSRVLKRVDAQKVWSVSCFFIAKSHRGMGLGEVLLHSAIRFASRSGASIVEGYPIDPLKGKIPDAFAWTGISSVFKKVGFQEVARRSPTRPILRYYCKTKSDSENK